MTLRSSWRKSGVLRRPRGLWVVLAAALYLCVGTFHAFAHHAFSHVDAARTAVPAVVMAVADGAMDNGAAGDTVIADHHCHGCLSVAMPAPPAVSADIAPHAPPPAQPGALLPDAPPGLETPPPKFLT